MFYVPDCDEFPTGASLEYFFGEPVGDKNGELLTYYADVLENRIPHDYLAIATCGGLDLVLLNCMKLTSGFGSVWFWDGTMEGEGGNIYWLANNFDEFLELLQFDINADYEEVESQDLFQSIERGKITAVERYVAEGGDLELRNERGQTLLMAAVCHSWPKIVRWLLEHSANPNSRDPQGRTPLHYAASSSIDSIKLLLAAGADAKARDNQGKGVLNQWSYRANQILIANGAELH
jgi:hypothetical protein